MLNLRSDDVVAEVMRLTGGIGADLVVDHGQTEAIELGARMLRKRGRMVVGAAYANTTSPRIEFGAICNQKELTFIGRTMSGGVQANAFALAIENVRAGRIKLDPIVTHKHPASGVPACGGHRPSASGARHQGFDDPMMRSPHHSKVS